MTGTDIAALADYRGMALALALGLLIGVQRGWVLRSRTAGTRFAGIRTFALLGLAGGLAGYLQDQAQATAAVLLAATAGLVLLGYYRATEHTKRTSGTAALVALLTVACGYLAGLGQEMLATIIGVIMVALLSMRRQLHGWVTSLNEAEMIAISRFALIALVILPLLPSGPYGPFGAWNPRQLWLVVVLVCGFSFAGYVASRRLGASRGTIATAAAGATVSSTAVTAALAARLRDGDGDPAILGAGIAAASVVMFLRVMVLVGAIAAFALPTFMTLMIPGLLASVAGTVWLLARVDKTAETTAQQADLRNPFDLKPALLLMALVMALSVASRWVLERYGDAGLATVLALSGVVDVDSAIITMGGLPPATLTPRIAGLVLLPPILLNTLFKAGVAVSIAGWRKGWRSAVPLVASSIAMLVPLAWV